MPHFGCLGVAFFFFSRLFALFWFGSTSIIKKAGLRLRGTLKRATTLSHYRSLVKAPQPDCALQGNSCMFAAVRNVVIMSIPQTYI